MQTLSYNLRVERAINNCMQPEKEVTIISGKVGPYYAPRKDEQSMLRFRVREEGKKGVYLGNKKGRVTTVCIPEDRRPALKRKPLQYEQIEIIGVLIPQSDELSGK